MTTALALLLAVPAQPYEWRNVEIVGGGFVTGVIPHPRAKDVVYSRTDIGGAYRWNPRTSRWVPLMDWITRPDWNLYGVESVGLDPSDSRRAYIAAGTYDNDWGGPGAILRTADGGRTWKRTDLPFRNGGNMPGRSIGERLAVDPADGRIVYFGTRNSGLWRSADHGATWSRVESFPKIVPQYDAPVVGAGWDRPLPQGHGVGWVLFDGPTIYAGVVRKEDNLYRSRDRGRTWELVPGQPKGLLPHQAKVGPDGTLTLAYSDNVGPNDVRDGAVWRYASRTGRWTNITPERPGEGNTFGYGGVSVRGDLILASTLSRWSRGDTVFMSRDAGRTWVSLKDTAVRDSRRAPYLNWDRKEAEFGHWIGDVEIDPHNPDRAWYVTGATIWGTENLRAPRSRWLPRAEGLEETAVLDLVSPPRGAHVVSALGDIAGFAHFDLRKSPPEGIWTNPTLVTTDDLDYAGLAPNVFVRVGRTHGEAPRNGAISHDGARTWRPLSQDVPGRRGSGTAALSADAKTLVWAPEGGPAHWTSDEGKTWTRCIGAPEAGRVVSDKVDPAAFYLTSGNRLYVSRDAGRTFAPAATDLPAEYGRLVLAYDRAGRLWLPGRTGGLRVSDDGGATFRRVPGVELAEQVGLGAPAPGRRNPALYLNGTVGGVIGVFRSTDDGATWVRINDARTGFGTMNVITGDPKKFGRVYLGTNGRGVLVADPR